MTSVKPQAEIHEWKCASGGSAFERAREARDSARSRRSARFFQSRGPTARCRALMSDRDPVPTQARETAAASKYHFGAAPGAPATASSRGYPPTPTTPRIPESFGQNKSKRQRGFRLLLRWRAAGNRLGKPARDRAAWSNPIRGWKPPSLRSRFRLGIAEPGRATGLPPRPLGRPEPQPWGRGRADWVPRSGTGGGAVLTLNEARRRLEGKMLGNWGRPHNRDPNLNSQCEPPLSAPRRTEQPAGVGSPPRRPVPKASSPTHPLGMPSGHLPVRTTDPATASARGWPRKGC